MAKVLIVDDDPATVELLTMAVQLKRHHAIPAYNGMEALDQLDAAEPDLVLLDLMMPGIDGLETLVRIRQHERHHSIPVILVTASSDESLDRRVMEAGGNGCLRKPVSMDTLDETIARQLDAD